MERNLQTPRNGAEKQQERAQKMKGLKRRRRKPEAKDKMLPRAGGLVGAG